MASIKPVAYNQQHTRMCVNGAVRMEEPWGHYCHCMCGECWESTTAVGKCICKACPCIKYGVINVSIGTSN